VRGVFIALGEIALFLLLAATIGIAIGFLLRDWLFANRAEELDEMLRKERAEYRRLELGAAAQEHQLQRTIVAREGVIEEMRAGQQPETIVLSNRPFSPGSVLRPPLDVAVPAPSAPSRDIAAPPARSEPTAATAPDDLQMIRGVGPTISRRLNEQGITTYRQLASMSEAEVGALADKIRIARGRVSRDDWVGAAAALQEQARRPGLKTAR
jgi:predicted flap endonuclease-1-like 5' DNA nuclease